MRDIGLEWRRHLRLTILRVLVNAPAYSVNDSVLTDAVRELGFGATRDQVRTEIQWLAEQGLATSEALGKLMVAVATQRGLDVAAGHATHEGVKRPSPEQ